MEQKITGHVQRRACPPVATPAAEMAEYFFGLGSFRSNILTMKKGIKIAAAVLLIGFIAIQFFGIDKTNPPVVDSDTMEAAIAVPPDISLILGRSCNDCHSNKTIYPWYANIQPSGWFLKGHIDDGRNELNFSKFNTFDTKKKVRKLEEICSEVESGQMPLPSYLWIHRDASLTESEKQAICSWTKSEIAKLEERTATK
jgi:Haem-binding domain